MELVIKELQVEVSKPNFFQAIVAKQFDNASRYLNVTLVDNGNKINVLDSSTVTINARRSDGAENKFYGSVNRGEGTVFVPLTYWMLELEGTVECDISVYGTSYSVLTTTKFIIEVERASCQGDGTPLEGTEITVLQGLINEVTELKDDVLPEQNYDADSTKAMSGKAVAEALQNVQAENTVIAGSTKPVSGGAVKTYVDSKTFEVTVDPYMSPTSKNPVQNKTVKEYVDTKIAEAGLSGGAVVEYASTIFDEFPSEDEIRALPDCSYFTVRQRGIYYDDDSTDVELVTYYVRDTYWIANALKYTGNPIRYVVPINQPVGELYMPYYGIKTGINNAEKNSEIMSYLTQEGANHGVTFRFPVGHFYFSEPIDASGKHISIIGTCETNHNDFNKSGVTFLHFTDLASDETALTVKHGVVADLVICGTEAQYNLISERNNAFTDVNTVFTETCPVKAYGLNADGGELIRNVGFTNFYFGCWCKTSNTFVDNVRFHQCHYGLSLGNDNKVTNISGAEVMVLLQLRGSLSSATSVRGDSIGKHLVEITDGGNQTLVDLDADFCMDSIVAINGDVNDLSITGVHGRAGVRHFFKTGETEITANDVTADTVSEYGVISVGQGNSLKGAYIVTNQSSGSATNPFDSITGYETPFVLLSAGSGTTVSGVQFVSTYNIDDELTEEWGKKRIACLNGFGYNCSVKVQTAKGSIIYNKDTKGTVTVEDDASYISKKMDLSSYAKEADVVKTVNGLTPDVNGNVEIEEVEPEVVGSIDDCVDITKKYVLVDEVTGEQYIYAYRKRFVPGGTTPNFTNQLIVEGCKENVLYNNDIENKIIVEYESDQSSDGYSTNLIQLPAPEEGKDVVIRINAMGLHATSGVNFFRALRDDYYAYSISKDNFEDITNGSGKYTLTGEYNKAILSDVEIHLNAETCDWLYSEEHPFIYVWFWILNTTPPEDVVITVNEEITYTVTEDHYVWEWVKTEPYIKPDYLAMITALADRVAKLEGAT